MKKINRTARAAIVVGAVLLLSACAAVPREPEVTPVDYKACMISQSGPLRDAAFKEQAYGGLLQAEAELGVHIAKTELAVGTPTAKATGAMTNLVAGGCDVIVVAGYDLLTSLVFEANANHDIDFILIDSVMPTSDILTLELHNVETVQFEAGEGAFMAGYLAASSSKTGAVATFGGYENYANQAQMAGFKQGVEYFNDKKRQNIRIMGTAGSNKANWSFLGNETDVNQAKARAMQFIKAGADVIYPVAGAASIGAGDATLEQPGIKVVGSYYDWYLDSRHKNYKQNILTSVQMKISKPVLEGIRSALNQQFNSEDNTAHYGVIDDGTVALTAEHEVPYPAGVLEELNEIKKLISAGELVVF